MANGGKKNILVVYFCATPRLRPTTREHLYCFREYSGHNCYYVNVAFMPVPKLVWKIPFDLVIFDTLFLCTRWNREGFLRLAEKVSLLKALDAPKIGLPQDEFISTDILCDFVNQMGLSTVFSVAPESEWPNIYNTVDRDRVKFHRVLTGYLSRRVLSTIARFGKKGVPRNIGIGYRTAGKPYAWFGRHGFLKQDIADLFLARAPQKGIKVDISTSNADTILGDDWYRFLLSCKYTIGVEGGTSILDRDGSIHERNLRYVKEHPDAAFEEIEAACFPGLDGTFGLSAISPRHLEACATKTCQILTSGGYNGILKPGIHYIELKRDFSNADEVLDLVASDRVRAGMAEKAYQDVVASDKYSYENFVRFVIENSGTSLS
ncbi:MAG: hypothetical protein HZB23_07195 [Deltaproteobacteria bacterium]|nr:hypothetical protein [Deltaproteobacteria bacterium]